MRSHRVVKSQKGFIQIPLAIALLLIVAFLGGVGVVLLQQDKSDVSSLSVPANDKTTGIENEELEQNPQTEQQSEEEGVVRVERCKARATLETQKYFAERAEKLSEECRAERAESGEQKDVKTLFGFSVPCFIPRSSETEKEKYYNQFYLDCLNSL